MKPFETSADQITIFYNVEDSTHVKTLAHAEGTGKEVLAIPYKDAPTAYNVWTRIYEQIPGDKNSIFDENDERYADLIEGREFTFDEWRNVVTHNPDLIKSVIAVSGENVVVINRPTEVYRLQELGPQDTGPGVAPAEDDGTDNLDEENVRMPLS